MASDPLEIAVEKARANVKGTADPLDVAVQQASQKIGYMQHEPQSGFENVLETFSSAVEFLQLPGAVVEAGIYDLLSATRGEESHKLKQLFSLQNLAKFAPFGSKPDVPVYGEDLLRKAGVEDNRWAVVGGIGIDLLTDPLLAADWIGAVGKVAHAVGAVEEAKRLEKLADTVRKLTAPSTYVQAAAESQALKGPVNTLQAIVERIVQSHPPGSPRVIDEAGRVPGLRKQETTATVGELIFPFGRVPGTRTFEGGNLNAPTKAFAGGEDVGPGIIRTARGTRSKFEHIINGNIQQIDSILRKYDPRRGAAYRQLDEIIGEHVRNFGGADWKEIGVGLPEVAEAVGKLERPEMVEDWTKAILRKARKREEFIKRLRAFHKLHAPHVPWLTLVNDADKAAAKAFATQVVVGYELSGYEDFTKLVKQAWQEAGDPYNDDHTKLLNWLWRAVAVERLPADVEKILKAEDLASVEGDRHVKRALKHLDFLMKKHPGFRKMNPLDYMQGVANGFITKITGRFRDPSVLEDLAANWEVALFDKTVASPEDVAKAFESFGDKVVEAVKTYVEGLPTPAVRLDDLLEVVKKADPEATSKLTRDSIKDVVAQLSPDFFMVEDTLAKILGSEGKGGPPLKEVLTAAADTSWSTLNPKHGLVTYKSRAKAKLRELFDATTVYQLTAATKQLSVLGAEAPREISFQTLLSETYKELERMGLIGKPHRTPRYYGEDGIVWINVPNDVHTWGEFAGKSVPLWAMREMLKVLRTPGQGRLTAWQRFVNILRKGYLSGWTTAVRNIVSNMSILYMNGLPVLDIMRRLPEARKVVQEYMSTGYSKELAGAEHLLNFLHDASIAKWFQNLDDELFYRIISQQASKAPSLDTFLKRVDAAVDKLVRLPPFGFLGLFQAAEDYSRAAVFLWARDALMSKGVSKEEAIKRAAHLAINATYDYTHVGEALNFVRKHGYALFPSFMYFTIGRVARTIYERPGQVAKTEHLVTAWNQAAVPDKDERRRLNIMLSHIEYLREHPLVIPRPGAPGHYYAIPLDYFLPQITVSPEGGLVDVLSEPVFGGALRPLVDAIYAWMTDTGEASPLSSKFGTRVFDEYATTPQKVLQTAEYVGKQMFTTGQVRLAQRFFTRTLPPVMDPEVAQNMQDYMFRYTNSSALQNALYYGLGTVSYEVDTTGDVTIIQLLRREKARLKEKLQQLDRDIRAALANNDDRLLEQLTQRKIELENEYADLAQKLLEGVR